MNKLFLVFFLTIYTFYGFCAEIETDPIKAFDALKAKYPTLSQKEIIEDENFKKGLLKIASLLDPAIIDNAFEELLDKMTAQEIDFFVWSTKIFFSTIEIKVMRSYSSFIRSYCKKRLVRFLQDFQGFGVFDFNSDSQNELMLLIQMSLKEKDSLLSKNNILSMLKAIVNLTYQDVEQNPDMLGLLQEISKGLNKYRFSKRENSQEEIILAEQARFKLFYLTENENNFSNVVKSDLPIKYQSLNLKNIAFDVIYNNNGYSNEEYSGFIKGNSINGETPIGYVMYVPKKEIKNIIVTMYGGFEKKDLKDQLSKPSYQIMNSEHLLLENGTVLIKLNLPDLLENNENQKFMAPNLLFKIHAAVNYFYEILITNPKLLHKSLEVLHDKPIFLMGSSFGGLMSVFHAMKYPATFAGYISHAGALYGKNGYDNQFFKDYLKVADVKKINKIEDPIFIHHSFDDNRVNVQAALEFYRLAKEAKKDNLIKLFIDAHGSNIYSKDPGLHGHFFPQGYYLKLYSEQLMDFINSNGKNIDPLLNEWRYEKFSQLAQRLNGLGSYVHKEIKRDVHKVLLSKGLERCNSPEIIIDDPDVKELIKKSKQGDQDAFDKLWSINIAPYLWEVFIEESLRPKSAYLKSKAFMAAYNLRLEVKRALENEDDAALRERVKNFLENKLYSIHVDDDLLITEDFIDNVLKDIKNWLHDEKEYKKFGSFNAINHAILTAFLNKDLFNLMLATKASSILSVVNDTNLKEDLLHALQQQRLKALKIIRDKIIRNHEKLKNY